MDQDINAVDVTEEAVLQKYEGEGPDARLVETIRVVNGVIVEQTLHPLIAAPAEGGTYG